VELSSFKTRWSRYDILGLSPNFISGRRLSWNYNQGPLPVTRYFHFPEYISWLEDPKSAETKVWDSDCIEIIFRNGLNPRYLSQIKYLRGAIIAKSCLKGGMQHGIVMTSSESRKQTTFLKPIHYSKKVENIFFGKTMVSKIKMFFTWSKVWKIQIQKYYISSLPSNNANRLFWMQISWTQLDVVILINFAFLSKIKWYYYVIYIYL
jgi:hypothetical protein